MRFEVVDSLSLPGDPAKPNEDAWAAEPFAAVVFDGATPVGDPLLPGKSDAAWIAQFGARRLMAHLRNGEPPKSALQLALADAERSFDGLRRRAPVERYEIPCASMMLVRARDGGIDALWYGDCSALVQRPGQPLEILGQAFDKRTAEAREARRVLAERGVAPVGTLDRAEFLPFFRAARNSVNLPSGTPLFAPDSGAAERAAKARIALPTGTLILLCSDGFLLLATDYGAYDAGALVEAARKYGLARLGGELRALEDSDLEGRRFPRFKKSDDATAVLVRTA